MKPIAAICFVLTTFFAVPSSAEEPVNVTLVQLITTPEKFDGKLIRIIGFLRLAFRVTNFLGGTARLGFLPKGLTGCAM